MLQKGADFLLPMQANQPVLADAFEVAFTIAKVTSSEGDANVTDEKNHGRQETCYHIVSEITDEFQEISYDGSDENGGYRHELAPEKVREYL